MRPLKPSDFEKRIMNAAYILYLPNPSNENTPLIKPRCEHKGEWYYSQRQLMNFLGYTGDTKRFGKALKSLDKQGFFKYKNKARCMTEKGIVTFGPAPRIITQEARVRKSLFLKGFLSSELYSELEKAK